MWVEVTLCQFVVYDSTPKIVSTHVRSSQTFLVSMCVKFGKESDQKTVGANSVYIQAYSRTVHTWVRGEDGAEPAAYWVCDCLRLSLRLTTSAARNTQSAPPHARTYTSKSWVTAIEIDVCGHMCVHVYVYADIHTITSLKTKGAWS
jgi:hypothetical protein